MRKLRLSALFLIAGIAFTWRVQAQPVYRCGNTYSQFPCPGAIPMDLADARKPEQKAQTQAATLTDARLAKTMEQERLAEEKRLLAANQATPPGIPEQPKRAQSGNKKPTTIEADVPVSEKQEVSKKKSGKKGKKPT